jgi:transposase-like protein
VVTLPVSCPHCQGTDVIRYGKTPDGRQRFCCRLCRRRSTADPRPSGYSAAEQELILRACQERSSLRGIARTFGVARNTVANWMKKKPRRCPP